MGIMAKGEGLMGKWRYMEIYGDRWR
jgi:hypothetical protein